MIVKFDEAALSKAFGPTFVEVMRHIIRQLGALTEQTTLPDLASQTDSLVPIVSGLTISLTATNVAVADLAADAPEHRYSDAHLVRRLDELQVEIERGDSERLELVRMIALLRDERESFDFNIADLSRKISQLQDAQP